MHRHNPTPRSIETRFDVKSGGLSAFRAGLEGVCHVELPDGEANFWARARGFHLGTAIMTEMHACSLHYRREARHVARAGYDHIQIHLGLAGESHVQSGRQSVTFRQGDIGIVDTLRAADTHVLQGNAPATHSLAIFVPRTAFAQLLSSTESEHCAVVRRETPVARLLTEHMLSLNRQGGLSASLDTRAEIQDLLGLLAGGLGAPVDAALPVREACRRAALRSVMRYIECNLDSPELSAASICRHFGYSRATVYRLFEPEAGLASYIGRQRLHRAFGLLISRQRAHRNILDVALEGYFASDATFSRAFRREFGIPPGEVRALARAWRIDSDEGDEPDGGDPMQAVRWIRRLGVQLK